MASFSQLGGPLWWVTVRAEDGRPAMISAEPHVEEGAVIPQLLSDEFEHLRAQGVHVVRVDPALLATVWQHHDPLVPVDGRDRSQYELAILLWQLAAPLLEGLLLRLSKMKDDQF